MIAWEQGDLDAASASLRHRLSIRGVDDLPGLVADALLDLAAVMHAGGRNQLAHPLLLEARELRQNLPAIAHGSVGEVDRLLGEVEISLGQTRQGVERLQQAIRQLRADYGNNHPPTRRAELVLAYHRTSGAAGLPTATAALLQLDALAQLPENDIELRDTIWRARAYAAQLRCHGPQRVESLRHLEQLDQDLRQARPEGGVIRREVDAIRLGCNARRSGRAAAGG